MSSFVATEFDCMYWQSIFVQAAHHAFNERQQKNPKKIIKQKQQEQEIATIKNQLIKTKKSIVVPELITKGKQFSTLVAQEFPNYNNCIRLSVHCDEEINIANKVPISLVYGNFGTPWHNTIVINQTNNKCGLFKDIFKKETISNQPLGNLEIVTKNNKTLSLCYIKK